VSVPQLVGRQYPDAAQILNDNKLKAKQKLVNSQQPAGTVVDQSKDPFTQVPLGTTITLSVSNGKVKLLDVRGKKADEAKQLLNGAGWTNVDNTTQVQETDKKNLDGTVAAESPNPGIAYPQSTTTIVLTVYKYVKPEPTCTTETAIPTGIPTDTASVLPPCTS
jgi:eukaryotic-like serine/threonine-protein kinase